MTPDELQQLRAWSAEVCGYTIDAGGYAWCSNERGQAWQQSVPWLPDQNIAQTFEVVDAVRYKRNGTYELRCYGSDHFVSVGGGPVVRHESRELALLLAAKVAWEAMSK